LGGGGGGGGPPFPPPPAARPLDRVAGSIAFVAAARSGFFIVKDPADPARRLFIPLKTNIARAGAGLAFRVRPATVHDLQTSVVEWEQPRVDGDVDEILASAKEELRTKTAREEAEEFLTQLLQAGETPVTEVRMAAAARGLSWAAVRRTQKVLDVVVRRQSEGNGGSGQWTWRLPPVVLP
jgi:hypothetical protein